MVASDLPFIGYDHEDGSSEGEEEEMFEIEGDLYSLDLTGDPSSPQHQQQHQQHYATLQDGFYDPSAFGSLQRRQLGAGKQAKRPPVDETADKLDSLMEMTFEHLQRRINAGKLLMDGGSCWILLRDREVSYKRCFLA